MANTKVTTGVIKDDAVGADQLASNSVVTASIVDNAITTAKINNDAILTAKISNSAVTNAKLAANSVDSDQYVDGSIDTAHIADGQITSAKLDTNISVSGTLTVGSHLSLGDSDEIRIGDSSDLKIYHDGSNSYVSDEGAGNLIVRGGLIALQNAGSTQNLAQFTDGGAATLYYAGAAKIATTSSGVDVTGTATMDGLTVDGDVVVNTGAGALTVDSFGGGSVQVSSNGAYKHISTLSSGYHLFEVNSKSVAKFNNNGDISFYEDTGTTAKFFWDASAESLGIGTTSPSSELHIKGASPAGIFNSQLLVDTTDTTGAENTGSKILFGYHDGVNNRTGPYIFGANTSGQSGHYSAYLAFGTRANGSNPEERMRIDASGNVGIGKSSPSTRLDITADNTLINSKGTVFIGSESTWGVDKGGQLSLGGRYTDSVTEITYGNISGRKENGTGGSGSGYLAFGTSANNGVLTEAMRISSEGDLLIGMTDNDVAQENGALIQSANGRYFCSLGSNSLNTYHVYSTVNNSYNFYVNCAGTIYSTNTSISSLSDERLKENIVDIDTGLTEVMSLKPRKFDWKDGNGKDIKNDTGFIAQEVETVLPDLIDGFMHNDLDDAKSVRMGDMIPTLVKAIQEQQTQIETLKQEIQELKG